MLFISMKKRILIKISGEMLSTNGKFIDKPAMLALKNELEEASKISEIGIVLGGGNFWRGRDNEELELFRGKSDHIGMLATVMNALSFSAFLEKFTIKTAVFSARSMPSFCEEFNLEKVDKAFEEGRICFFCGGTGSPFFTTDSASALRAIEIKADMYAKATTIDGVYDSDPRKNSDAKKYKTVSFQEVIAKQLQVMDTAAFALCNENNLAVQIFDGSKKGNISKVLKGETIGTIVK
ncbi:TPA: UMP kinase [Candidatus Peregrinibacteria bacterium]|nr:UMP kinase [Candidatus Peregrinibacteria bacterium]